MPRSKKSQLVTLSKTTTKGKEGKENLILLIRQCLEDFKHLYVFSFHNMRTSELKEVRTQWNTSRFFFGKNKVMQVALGRTDADEQKEKLHLVSERVQGNCCLFFTNEPEKDVLKFFKNYRVSDYPRSGFEATQTISLPAGPTTFVHSLETYLRTKLGMPTSLKNGIVSLEKEFLVCTTGQELTPEQARIVKLLEVKMSEFYFELECVWSAGKFKKF